MFSKILLATDGSDDALRAARRVVDMIKGQSPTVTVLSAAYVPSMYRDDIGTELTESFVEDAQRALRFTQDIFEKEDVTCETKMVQDLHPAEAILREAEAGGYDLIALGSRGLSARQVKKLGSISHEVANRAVCSVLLVR
jgi:nucleotide-binding universal stress UspA family protein